MSRARDDDANRVEERTPQEAAYELALAEVEAVMANIEQAQRRAEKALAAVARPKAFPHLELAVQQVTKELDELIRRLVQQTYFAREEQAAFTAAEPQLFGDAQVSLFDDATDRDD